jgi:hypothetical protein
MTLWKARLGLLTLALCASASAAPATSDLTPRAATPCAHHTFYSDSCWRDLATVPHSAFKLATGSAYDTCSNASTAASSAIDTDSTSTAMAANVHSSPPNGAFVVGFWGLLLIVGLGRRAWLGVAVVNCIVSLGRGPWLVAVCIPRYLRTRISATTDQRDDSVQFFFRDHKGNSHTLHGKPSDAVAAIKRQVQAKTGIHPKHQILTYAGKQLKNGRTLGYYNIQKVSTVHLTLRLCGGMMPPAGNQALGHYRKNIAKLGFFVSTVACNFGHLLNYTVSLFYRKDSHHRDEYVNAECRFMNSTAAQTMPGQNHDPVILDIFFGLIVLSAFWGFITFLGRQQPWGGTSFRWSIRFNAACNSSYLVYSTYWHVQYLQGVSIAALVAYLMCEVATFSSDLRPEEMGTLLNNTLGRFFLRVNFLIGYLSLVIQVVLVHADEFCSVVGTTGSYVLVIGLPACLLLVFAKIQYDKSRTTDADWRAGSADRARWLDSTFKKIYLSFMCLTYLNLQAFYSTNPQDYTSTLQPHNPQFDIECASLCHSYVDEAKGVWVMALASLCVIFEFAIYIFDFNSERNQTFQDCRALQLARCCCPQLCTPVRIPYAQRLLGDYAVPVPADAAV